MAEGSPAITKQATFGDFGALGELLGIIKQHMDFMRKQEDYVNEYISKQNSPEILRAAKTKALETERDLMNQIKNITVLTEFLNNIILIENLFNSYYTPQQRQKQQVARKTHAPNIAYYESKPKAISDVNSFMELMFAGTNVYLPTFKKFLETVEAECTQKGINMVSNSGAKGKNIERAFYKSFYVYAVKHGDKAFKQMTDVLRCSLVFDNFDDLYKCFAVIEQLANADQTIGGILRVKDRYNPATMPFGYRDMLINIYCPGSKVVCEIQLHHLLFYKCKKISHKMYKKARLFEDEQTDENLAYKFADKEIRPQIGDKVYELKDNDVDDDDDEDDESAFEKHEYELTLKEVFEKYKGGLAKFVSKFHEDGYGEEDEAIGQFIEDLPYFDEIEEFDPSNKESWEELAEYGMKIGHVKKYKKMLSELKGKKDEWEALKAKREKRKKKQKEKQSAMQMPSVQQQSPPQQQQQQVPDLQAEEVKQDNNNTTPSVDLSKWTFEFTESYDSQHQPTISAIANEHQFQTLRCKAGTMMGKWAAFGPMLSGSDKVKVVVTTSNNGSSDNYKFALATPQWSVQQESYQFDNMLVVEGNKYAVHVKNDFKGINNKQEIKKSALAIMEEGALADRISICVDMQQRKAWFTTKFGSMCVNVPESVRIVFGLGGSDEKKIHVVELQPQWSGDDTSTAGGQQPAMLMNTQSNPASSSSPQRMQAQPAWNASKSNPMQRQQQQQQQQQPMGGYGMNRLAQRHNQMGSGSGLGGGGMFGMMGAMNNMMGQQLAMTNQVASNMGGGLYGGAMGGGMGMMGQTEDDDASEQAFTNALAQNIAQDDDQQFNQAYNSLYGNNQQGSNSNQNRFGGFGGMGGGGGLW